MKMKKILSLIIIVTFLLTGCNSDKKYNEYMDSGEEAVTVEEYEDALEYFEMALEEKAGDEEATSLHTQVEKLLQVQAKMKNKLYDEAIDLCSEIINSESDNSVCRDKAQSLKTECEKLKEEQESLTFKEEIQQKISEAKELMDENEYINAKAKLNYVIKEITGKSGYTDELKECNSLIRTCEKELDKISNKKESSKKDNTTKDNKDSNKNSNTKDNTKDNTNNKTNDNTSDDDESQYTVDFNSELKRQIAVAGASYVEFYFEYGDGVAPSKFAEQSYEDTENDTPLGEYKEEGKAIFMNAFKEAYEETGNEYY